MTIDATSLLPSIYVKVTLVSARLWWWVTLPNRWVVLIPLRAIRDRRRKFEEWVVWEFLGTLPRHPLANNFRVKGEKVTKLELHLVVKGSDLVLIV